MTVHFIFFPTCDDVLEFIAQHSGAVGKKEICNYFNIQDSHRSWLKLLLKRLKKTGKIRKSHGNLYHYIGHDVPLYHQGIIIEWFPAMIPPLYLVKTASNIDIYAVHHKNKTPLKKGDHVMVKMNHSKKHKSAKDKKTGKIVKRIPADAAKETASKALLASILSTNDPITAQALSKKQRELLILENPLGITIQQGDIVSLKLPLQKIVKKIAPIKSPRYIIERVVQEQSESLKSPLSLLALHEHDAPYEFSQDVLQTVKQLPAPQDKDYHDLTELAFVTIDPADAKDHDDAVFAIADNHPDNQGGFIVYVAIADVSHYVRVGNAVDLEARQRGNSIYLPDRVVPMLPDILSTDLCSLKAGQKRPALVVKIQLSATGHRKSHHFMRAMIKCQANLSYEQVYALYEQQADSALELYRPILTPLFQAYQAACEKRHIRQPLALDLPEYKIILTDTGTVSHIVEKQKLFTHQLIEEFMVMANVCAAETLQKFMMPIIYRVHEAPSEDKVGQLKEVFKEMGFSLSTGNVLKPILFNQILHKAQPTPFYDLVNKLILRCQSQAKYQIENLGHFGLNLPNYVHFTSPIRRYADLMIHRALIEGLSLGEGILGAFTFEQMAKIADYISKTERRAMQIEMETKDRYLAEFMNDKIDTVFEAMVSGISNAGLFVRITAYGAEGIIPMASLSEHSRRFFVHDEKTFRLVDRHTGDFYRLGQTIQVVLKEATPITGGMRFAVVNDSCLQAGGKSKKSQKRAKPVKIKEKIRKKKPRKLNS